MAERELTEPYRKLLTAWNGCDEDMGYLSFSAIARRSGTEPFRVRRMVRHLARKGMTVFGKGLWLEDGSRGGAGYAITPAGRSALNEKEGGRDG